MSGFFNLAECWVNECLMFIYVLANELCSLLLLSGILFYACPSVCLFTSWRTFLWLLIFDSQEKYQQPQICRWHHPYDRKQRRTEEPLDESERGDWKSWLKLNIQITKIMASGPITSWQIDGETVKTVTDFILGGSKMKGWSQSKNHTQLWMWLVIEARSNAVKSNSA